MPLHADTRFDYYTLRTKKPECVEFCNALFETFRKPDGIVDNQKAWTSYYNCLKQCPNKSLWERVCDYFHS